MRKKRHPGFGRTARGQQTYISGKESENAGDREAEGPGSSPDPPLLPGSFGVFGLESTHCSERDTGGCQEEEVRKCVCKVQYSDCPLNTPCPPST